jgi:hypothetical protein
VRIGECALFPLRRTASTKLNVLSGKDVGADEHNIDKLKFCRKSTMRLNLDEPSLRTDSIG